MPRVDYYRVLGGPRNISDDEIKKAYRKLVFEHHPDRNPNNSKAEEKIRLKTGTAQINNLLQNIRKPENSQRIAFPGREGFEFIETERIIYAKAEGSYTHVFLTDKRKIVISKTLSDIEEILAGHSFQRIHHSTLVNLLHVTHLLKTDGGYVVLDTGEKLPVSKSKKDFLMESLGLKKL